VPRTEGSSLGPRPRRPHRHGGTVRTRPVHGMAPAWSTPLVGRVSGRALVVGGLVVVAPKRGRCTAVRERRVACCWGRTSGLGSQVQLFAATSRSATGSRGTPGYDPSVGILALRRRRDVRPRPRDRVGPSRAAPLSLGINPPTEHVYRRGDDRLRIRLRRRRELLRPGPVLGPGDRG